MVCSSLKEAMQGVDAVIITTGNPLELRRQRLVSHARARRSIHHLESIHNACCAGYSGSLLNPGGFRKIDEEVWRSATLGFSVSGLLSLHQIACIPASGVQGNKNAIRAAKQAGSPKVVLMTSLLTNAKAAGQGSNPNYRFLNLLGGVLDAKLEVVNRSPALIGALQYSADGS